MKAPVLNPHERNLQGVLGFIDKLGKFFQTEVQQELSTGDMIVWLGNTAKIPSGWIKADGTVLLRLAYPELFSVLSTTYNTGGETAQQFRLPNQTATPPFAGFWIVKV